MKSTTTSQLIFDLSNSGLHKTYNFRFSNDKLNPSIPETNKSNVENKFEP